MKSTKICEFFLKGKCKYGVNCRNLHPNGNPQMQQQNSMSIDSNFQSYGNNQSVSFQNQHRPGPNVVLAKDKTLCKFFLTGNCSNKNCQYLHGFSTTLRNIQSELAHQTEIIQVAALNKENFLTCDSSCFKVWTLNPSFTQINEQPIEGTISKLVVSNGKVIIGTFQELMYGFFFKFIFSNSQILFENIIYIFI